MVEKKIRKVISNQLPLKSFNINSEVTEDLSPEEQIKQKLYEKFGDFPGEMAISVNQTVVNVKWYIPKIDNKAEFFHKKALGFAKEKDYSKAIESWQEAINFNPSDPDYHFYLGLAYLESSKFAESIEPFKKVLELCPVYPKVFLYLGTLFLKLRKFEFAEEYIRNNLFFYLDHVPSYLNLGIVSSILRKYDDALKMYQKTLELVPTEARAYMGLAKIYSLQGQVEKANDCFHKVIELDKTQQLANYAKRAIVKTKVSPEPGPSPVTAEVPDPHANPEDFYSEGFLAYLAGDYLKAETMYQRYLSLKADDSYVWCALGEVQMRSNKIDQAIAAFKKAISIDEKGSYYKELAVALNFKQQMAECYQAVQTALKLGKSDSVVYLLGGKSLCAQKRYPEAREMLEEALRLNRNNFSARYYLAIAASQLGDKDRAIQELEEIKTVKINFPLKNQASQMLAKITGQTPFK